MRFTRRERRDHHPRDERRGREIATGQAQGTLSVPAGAEGASGSGRMGDAEALRAIWGGYDGQPPALVMEQQLTPPLPTTLATSTQITVPLRNVGLISKIRVRVTFTVTGGGTSTQTLVGFGPAAFLSNVIFQDYSTYQRINTGGWHLDRLASAQRGHAFLAALTSDSPTGYANQNPATLATAGIAGQQAPTTITANAHSVCQVVYDIPFARMMQHLRGALWAKFTQSNAFLFLTINPTLFVASTGDPTFAMYQSAGSDLATLSNVAFEFYQFYLDQIPRDKRGAEILPWEGLQDAYLLNQTVTQGLIANSDNSIAFTDDRQFYSLAAVYDNNKVTEFGNDINYFELVSANLTPIFKRTPQAQLNTQRDQFFDDLALGSYFFNFSQRPIDTRAYGNVQLVVNPSSGGSTSIMTLGFEQFGKIGTVSRATAIPSGA